MWSEMIQRLLNEENLLIGIRELSEIADVSSRQLRYWEEKGYISSVAKDDNSARKYQLPMVVKVRLIKRFLDDGYTLQRSVEKAAEQKRNVAMTKKIFSKTFHGISEVCPGYAAIDMGDFDCSGQQRLYVLYDETEETTEYVVLAKEGSLKEYVETQRIHQKS